MGKERDWKWGGEVEENGYEKEGKEKREETLELQYLSQPASHAKEPKSQPERQEQTRDCTEEQGPHTGRKRETNPKRPTG